jgi:hypothetical protein
MMKKTNIPHATISVGVMPLEEMKVILQDLPTTVRGFCFHDDAGDEYVVLNSRLTREQNLITYDHERRHIRRGDMYDPNYIEYKEE